MSNRIALIVIGALLIVSAFQQIFCFDNKLLLLSYSLAEIMALIMMLANGTFSDRSYFNAAYALIGMTILGAMFKILHWTGADQLLILCPAALVILYVIHFITKPAKDVQDILKLLTAVSYPAVAIPVAMHWIDDSWTLRITSVSIFWVTFGWFLAEGIRKKHLFAKENS